MLIDGDHTEDGLRMDIKHMLEYIPQKELWVLMHDSFNPGCRSAIVDTPWEDYPYVHFVDVDFVPGIITPCGDFKGQMWGGFALAVIKETKCKLPLERGEICKLQFDQLQSMPV